MVPADDHSFCVSVWVPFIGVIRVPAVSGLADRSALCGEIANSQNTEATDYTETTRISEPRIEGWFLTTITAFAYPCGFRSSV
jgi:hypothetical protein